LAGGFSAWRGGRVSRFLRFVVVPVAFFPVVWYLFRCRWVVPRPAPWRFFRGFGVFYVSFRSLLFSRAVHVGWRSVRFLGRSFRSFLPGPVGGLRPGRVLPALRSFLLWCGGRGALLVARRRLALRRFLGFPARPVLPLVLRSLRPAVPSGVLAGVRSGLPAARARWPGSGVPRPRGPVRRVLFPVRWRLVVASLPLLPATAAPPVVGFSGGRRLSPAFRPLVAGVVASVLASGRSVAVGCAGGADAFVRAAAPYARVFAVPGSGWRPAAWFATRSVALVRAAAAGGSGSGLVAFPAAPCPVGLLPSALPAACFCGLGSGSWASAAFAAGLGLPLVVFPCGFSALPPWGVWVPAGSGVWVSGWRLVVA